MCVQDCDRRASALVGNSVLKRVHIEGLGATQRAGSAVDALMKPSGVAIPPDLVIIGLAAFLGSDVRVASLTNVLKLPAARGAGLELLSVQARECTVVASVCVRLSVRASHPRKHAHSGRLPPGSCSHTAGNLPSREASQKRCPEQQ